MTDKLVIVPTYNERKNIERLLSRIFSLSEKFDVLIVDDNSPDKTAALVTEMQSTYPGRLHLLQRKGKQGLGTAYIAGFKWALERHYQYIIEMDADLSHNPDDLPELYRACANEKADLSIGSRYLTGVNVVNWPIMRILMSYFASFYVRFITGIPVYDTTAGFKCFRRELLEAIDLDSIRFKGYAFQIEMKFTAWKLGYKLKEVPIIFTDRTEGESKMSGGIFKEAVIGVLKMKWKSLTSDYPVSRKTG